MTMGFDWLYHPADLLDEHLAGGLQNGAGLGVVLLLALLLGLRHALDPDHLVAVTSLVSGTGAGPSSAARLGAAWGAGHASILLAVGLPLIAAGAAMPVGVEQTAERAIGAVLLLLAGRLLLRCWRSRRERPSATTAAIAPSRRTQRHAATIGALHGLGGTGAITVLFLTLLPDRTQAALALAVFAPMAVISMTFCTGAFAWSVTRAGLWARSEAALTLPLGIFGLLFGGWYAGAL